MAGLTGHKDPYFLSVMDQIAQLMRYAFMTQNRTTMSLPGTGGAGMEAAMANLIQPGDSVVVGNNGLFASRMSEIVGRCGGDLVQVDAEWGRPVDPGDVERALSRKKTRVVALVHGETSTGVEQPIDEIGRIAERHGAMLVVDAVATLGGIPVEPDRWGASICYSASQKCLSAPPGLAAITVSDDTMAYIRGREKPVDCWYLDLDLHDRYWFAPERAYHHTAPVLMGYALHEALRLVAEEGLEARFARHRLHSRALVAGLESLGVELFADPAHRLATVISIVVPEGVNDARVRGSLLNEYGIEISGGLGAQTGKMWRVGVMGYSASRENMIYFLDALETLLTREGYWNGSGVAKAAAEAVYASDAQNGANPPA